MKSSLKSFLMLLAFGSCFLVSAEEGVPELAFDSSDDKCPIGIKLNLPESIVKLFESYKNKFPSNIIVPENQEALNNLSQIEETNDFAKVVYSANQSSFYIPWNLLEYYFFFYFQNVLHFGENGGLACTIDSKGCGIYVQNLKKLYEQYF